MALETFDPSDEASTLRYAAMFRGTRKEPNATARLQLARLGYFNTTSFQDLEKQLGSEADARSLVMHVGSMILAKGNPGLPLGSAIDRILSSMTQDERAAVATGGALPPRVQGIIDDVAATQARHAQPDQGRKDAATDASSLGFAGVSGMRLSGARFDRMDRSSEKGDWSSDAALSHTRALASQLGMPWAANNPDLLRQGPEAMKLLYEMHFQQASYEKMKNAGFSASEIVGLNKYAKKHHIDANTLAGDVADSVNTFGGNDPAERQRWKDLFTGALNNPDSLEAKKKLNDALEEQAKKHPEQAPQVKKVQDDMKLVEQTGAKADATDKNVAQTAEKKKQVTASVDDLLAAPPGDKKAVAATPPAKDDKKTPTPAAAPVKTAEVTPPKAVAAPKV